MSYKERLKLAALILNPDTEHLALTGLSERGVYAAVADARVVACTLIAEKIAKLEKDGVDNEEAQEWNQA